MKNRIFISFAAKDEKYRDLLKGQAENKKSPFSFTDMSVKEPWDEKWKTNCRTKIKGCDGVIVLLSENIRNADGALWEIKCSKEENVPLIGLFIHSDDYYFPEKMYGAKKISWTWNNIAEFLESL